MKGLPLHFQVGQCIREVARHALRIQQALANILILIERIIAQVSLGTNFEECVLPHVPLVESAPKGR